jgi:O-antigen ligase
VVASTGGALIATRPQAYPYIVGAGLLVAVASVNPLYPLGAALLLAPVDINFLFGNAQVAGVNASDAVIFLLVAAATLRCAVAGQIRISRPVVLTLALSAAIFIALAPMVFADTRAGLKFLGQVSAPVAAYLVARNARFSPSDERVLRMAAMLIGASLALAALLTVIVLGFGGSVVTRSGEDVSRFAGSLGSGSFAFFLLPSLILTIAALSLRVTASRTAALVLIGVPLLLTVTRSALLAAAVAVVYFAVVYGTRGHAFLVVVMCVVIGLAIVALSPASLNRFRATNTVHQSVVEGTLKGRKLLWDFIWRTDVAPSPVVGSGLGATAPIFAGKTAFHTGAGAVHNDYLYIWAQIGLLGLAGYLAFMLTLLGRGLRSTLRARRSPGGRDPREVILYRAIPPLIICYLIVSYFDNVLANFAHFGVPVFVLVGLGLRTAAERRHVEDRVDEPLHEYSRATSANPSFPARPTEGRRRAC